MLFKCNYCGASILAGTCCQHPYCRHKELEKRAAEKAERRGLTYVPLTFPYGGDP